MSSPVDKVDFSSPPSYLEQATSSSPKKRENVKYIVAGVTTVVVVAMVIGAVLAGTYLQNRSTKELVKEFSVMARDKDGKVDSEKVKIDTKNNEEEVRKTNGKLRVLEDYNRGIVVMRTTIEKLACFIKPLNKTGVTEPKALKNYLDTLEINDKDENEEDNVVYKPASDPVEDTSFLSAHAQEMCKGLDVFWMLPTEHKDAARTTRATCYRYICYTRVRCRRLFRRVFCYRFRFCIRIRRSC